MGLLYRLHRERKLRVIIPLDGTGPPRLESPNKNSDIQPGIAHYKVSPTSQGPAREHGTNKTRQCLKQEMDKKRDATAAANTEQTKIYVK